MPPLKDLTKYLDKAKVKYEVLEHKTVYTAMDKAGTLHQDPKSIAKTTVLKLDSQDYAIALVAANKLLDKGKIKTIINDQRKKAGQKVFKKVDFAKEAWMKKNISGQLGATPPFGSLWNLPTYADSSLLARPKIIVNAGDYNISLQLTKAAFQKALPDIVKGSFSLPKKKK